MKPVLTSLKVFPFAPVASESLQTASWLSGSLLILTIQSCRSIEHSLNVHEPSHTEFGLALNLVSIVHLRFRRRSRKVLVEIGVTKVVVWQRMTF